MPFDCLTIAALHGMPFFALRLYPVNPSTWHNQVNGLVEIKTIPRPDDTAATTAIQNYLLKATPGKRADWFVVYYADRVNEVLRPYGFYRRGFANSIETLWRSEKEGE